MKLLIMIFRLRLYQICMQWRPKNLNQAQQILTWIRKLIQLRLWKPSKVLKWQKCIWGRYYQWNVKTWFFCIKKLFNQIFDDGNFLSCWNESYTVLIHKKGSKNDPANYRGISLTSCLGKLFNKVINARLLKYIDSRNLISENQIGF